MKPALALLVVANLLLAFAITRIEEQREVLAREKTELETRLVVTASSREAQRALAALVESYGALIEDDGRVRELGIAAVRDTLFRAERGLALERLSLEFRPETDLARGFSGSRVQASLRGSYDALYQYLSRLESLYLPLAPAELTLRGEGDGALSLSVRFTTAWPVSGSGAAGSLSGDQVARLSRWLTRRVTPVPARDPFQARSAVASGEPTSRPSDAPPLEPVARELPPGEPALGQPAPELVGFVVARPEVEPDVNRRVLAALRFEGKLYLTEVGESLGSYSVEAIDSRESVTLVDGSTGERILVRLP